MYAMFISEEMCPQFSILCQVNYKCHIVLSSISYRTPTFGLSTRKKNKSKQLFAPRKRACDLFLLIKDKYSQAPYLRRRPWADLDLKRAIR